MVRCGLSPVAADTARMVLRTWSGFPVLTEPTAGRTAKTKLLDMLQALAQDNGTIASPSALRFVLGVLKAKPLVIDRYAEPRREV